MSCRNCIDGILFNTTKEAMYIHQDNLYFEHKGQTLKMPYSEKALEAIANRGLDITPITTINGRLKRELYPFQFTAILKCREHNWNLLLADQMGVGKTLTAIACSVAYGAEKTLYVVPANVKYQWQDEILRSVSCAPIIHVCEGQNFTEGDLRWIQLANHIIINYQIVNYWVEALSTVKYDFMILDEAHKIKHRQSQCAKACHTLKQKADHAICLSGTPLTDRTADIWNVVRFVDPAIFPSEFAFQQRYCTGLSSTTASVSVNTLDLHRQLHASGVMLRRTKKDVYKQLPKIVTEIVPLKVDSSALVEAEKKSIGIMRNMVRSIGSGRNAMQFKFQASMEEYMQEAVKAKMPLMLKWIEDFIEDSDEKLVVAVVHREKAGHVIYRHFKDCAVLIDGAVTAKNKSKLKEQFCTDPKIRLLIGNVQSIGTGIDGLQSSCSSMAVCELPWSPADYQQLLARLDRNGQKETVNIFVLSVYGSVDSYLAGVLDRKARVLREVLDGRQPDDVELITELMKVYDAQNA